eukprot:CAMPEP_0116882102 /NCGR_PEP_ID=MMETSP0463-20121206/14266_1 /TAXON_ID=181622 /ORGANISM="Strombidinopsis sp, Strain SopsisLIS2011" /LENGTH=203 /DNA_ID=CAMNT_0004534815 /DNA_START=24 /DNA_END=636 /DNA_ORIENTATION=+
MGYGMDRGRGAPRGGSRGFGGGRGGFGGRGGRGGFQQGPPATVVPVAEFSHECEGEIIAYIKGESVPLLARQIFTEKKALIGKVDDVFGPMHSPGIAIKPDQASGIQSFGFKEGDKLCADPEQLRNKTFFLPRTAASKKLRPLNQQGFKPEEAEVALEAASVEVVVALLQEEALPEVDQEVALHQEEVLPEEEEDSEYECIQC